MSDCILCGEASGGSEYAVCGECCEANADDDTRYLQRPGEPSEWRISEKRSGAFAFAVGIVALLGFSAGVACGWLLL